MVKLKKSFIGERRKIEADAVILAMSYLPNTELGKKAGAKINKQEFIQVDRYMRIENPDILVVGDCTEKYDFIARKQSTVMLASTAGAAGLNESAAKKEWFDVTFATFTGIDKHPGTFNNNSKQKVKLIVSKIPGVIIDAEVVGGEVRLNWWILLD